MRGLKNFKAEQPHQHAIYYMNVIMSEQMWTKEELLDATDGRQTLYLFDFSIKQNRVEICPTPNFYRIPLP